MRAERRQELKTNELAQMLEQGREFLRTWGSYLLGGLVVVVVVMAFMVYRAKAAEQKLTDAWQRLRAIERDSFFTAKDPKDPRTPKERTDAEIKAGFDGLQTLADETDDPDLLFEVLQTHAVVALELAKKGEGGTDPAYLDKAQRAYEAMRSRLPNNPMAVATALNGTVFVEAQRFVIDNDPARKEKVRTLLEQLAGDPRFNLTPFQKAATDRLNTLDEVFKPVVLAPAPKPMTLTPTALPRAGFEGPPAPPKLEQFQKITLSPEPPATAPPVPPVSTPAQPAPAPAPAEGVADEESGMSEEPAPPSPPNETQPKEADQKPQ